MHIDWTRITNPLRIAKGSHEEGSGKGCVMNVVSYVNGDVYITDYPECSARPLARIVQLVNDRLAGVDGYLSPENAVVVLELGFATMGTADVPKTVSAAWWAELLDSPGWGVARYATNASGLKAITAVADLYRRVAAGGIVSQDEWYAANAAAKAADAYAAANAAYAAAAARVEHAAAAANAAYAAAAARVEHAAYAAAAYTAAADAYAAYAANAAAYTAANARVEHARQAIAAWRRLAGMDNPTVVPAVIDAAPGKMVARA